MSSPPRVVKCPCCGTEVPWVPESRHRPFCSARCRQIDLGAWAAEEYRLPEPDPSRPDSPAAPAGEG